MEVVHIGHVNGGEWRLGGKGEKKNQKGHSERRPVGGTQHAKLLEVAGAPGRGSLSGVEAAAWRLLGAEGAAPAKMSS